MYEQYDTATLERLHKAELQILEYFIEFCARYEINYFAISGTAIGALRHRGFIPWDDDIDIAMLREDYEKFVESSKQHLSSEYELIGPEFERSNYNLQPSLVKKGTRFINPLQWSSGMQSELGLDLFVYDNIPEDPEKAKKFLRKIKVINMLNLSRNVHFGKLLKYEPTLIGKIKYLISEFIGVILRIIPNSKKLIHNWYLRESIKYKGQSGRYTALTDPGAAYMYLDSTEIKPYVFKQFENLEIPLVHEYDAQIKRHMGPDYMTLPPLEKRTNHQPVEIDFGDLNI